MNDKEHQRKLLKIGKFHIATEILRKAIFEEDQELLKQLKTLFAEFIIIDAECNFARGMIEYTAYHPKFRLIPEGDQLLTYPIELKEIVDEHGDKYYKLIKTWET